MESIASQEDLQSDEFIEKYLKQFSTKTNFKHTKKLLPYDIDLHTWEEHTKPIVSEIHETFKQRIYKIKQDLRNQDQYIMHTKFPEHKILFND